MKRYFALFTTHIDTLGHRDEMYQSILRDRHLSIGWPAVNPFDFHTLESLREALANAYPDLHGNNINHGRDSLSYFKSLRVGDIVVVRGTAKVLDVVTIVGDPYYFEGEPVVENYRMKVRFEPLFEGHPLSIDNNELTEVEQYNLESAHEPYHAMKSLDPQTVFAILRTATAVGWNL